MDGYMLHWKTWIIGNRIDTILTYNLNVHSDTYAHNMINVLDLRADTFCYISLSEDHVGVVYSN